MDILQEASESNRKSFLSHVFSTTEEGKAELLNVVQYACLGIIPVVALNKGIQRFIPEADPEKSSLEITIEVFLQIIIMFCGVVFIHRIISYFPTYSGFKYEHLTVTNVILAFLIIVLSIQTKMGLKVNILAERLDELWNGSSQEKKQSRQPYSNHTISQSDYMNHNMMQNEAFPPAPVITSNNNSNTSYNQAATHAPPPMMEMGPMPANSMGSSFGTFY